MIKAIERAANKPTSQIVAERLGEVAAASKTIQRAPELAAEVLTQAAAEGLTHVYAPVETFVEYFQRRGEDPAAVAADLTGDGDALRDAQQTGVDLRIPTARYITQLAATAHQAFFAEEIRLQPEALNGREWAAFAADQAARVPAPAPVPNPAAPLRAAVQQQLEAAGIPAATATTYAEVLASGFTTLATRAGVDPVALYTRYGLTVARGAGPQTREAGVTELTQPGDPYDDYAQQFDAEVAPSPSAPPSTPLETVPGVTPAQRAEFAPVAPTTEPTPPRQLFQGPRGSLVIGPDGRLTINLFDHNLSTMFHESGHAFLQIFSDLAALVETTPAAARTPEQQQILADRTALLAWLGAPAGAALTTAQHEQFARGFEAYVMEGQAPSPALRSVFARARAWLLSVYRSAAGLNVRLNPTVRAVFDRMLATD